MAENCTIYCKTSNRDELARLVHAHFPDFNPAGDTWNAMQVQGEAGTLRLTPKVFRERGDDFCRLLLSTCAFIERLANDDSATKKRLEEHVVSCTLVLGVVAEPAFDSDERYHAIVFAVANALDGIIFNGSEMLDADGKTLISTHST